MIPFLLDDIANLHHAEILRELAADQQAAQASSRTRPRSRLRMRAGQIFISAGAFLLKTRTMTPGTSHATGVGGEKVTVGSLDR